MRPHIVLRGKFRSWPRRLTLEIWLPLTVVLLVPIHAIGRPPPAPAETAPPVMAQQHFLREYPLGVHRIPLDGGRIYGWKISDAVTFGRFKGENDEFGFSVELNSR